MQLIQDSKEQNPLRFIKTEGVEIVREHMDVGDYTARHGGKMDTAVVERKEIGDCFSSFSSGYEKEKAKMIRAIDQGLKYIIAIEAPLLEVREGHVYWKQGEEHRHPKDGLSQIRQFMTLCRRYERIPPYLEVWYCSSRKDMAFRIMEYFLAKERGIKNKKEWAL